ncbi:MAG: aminotransferase class V-fold PLP-dependent enzyme [Planctomycetes bacterium]|nr:aminotransferase class V-fold PLP-dependent enzyme [Planctomycetota bacterium]
MPELLTESERHALFPVTREWAYLDNARRGSISAPAAAAAVHYIEGLRDGGVTTWPEWQRVWDETNAGFARFIGADADEFQFLVNATESFARVTLGIDWQPGDHAVVAERDYPGVVRAMLDLRRRGVEITLVKDRDDHSRPVEDLLNAINDRTRLVAASWVDFRTGWKLDAKALAEGCRERGVYSFIDAVQAVGAMAVDMHDVGCDFATFAMRKYLCGLDTLGALYVRRESLDVLTPHTQGLFSVANPFDFETLEQPYAKGAARFALGTPSMVQVYALQAALELQFNYPVVNRVNELAEDTLKMAREAVLKALADAWSEENRSQIVVLKREGKLADDTLQERLNAAKVAASARQGILRIAPHWYNSANDLQRLFEVLR